MRRRDREITDIAQIERVMRGCEAASFAFGGGAPYVVPMNFGYDFEDGRFTLYMHGAKVGEKCLRIAADDRVAFSMYTRTALLRGEEACEWGMDFLSVCGSGRIRIANEAEKAYGLARLMAHYAGEREWTFAPELLEQTNVFIVEVETISGKNHGKLAI